MASNTSWFQLVAQCVREIVDESDGAIVRSRDALVEELILTDQRLRRCPQTVFDHLTLALRQQDMVSCSFRGNDDKVLLIHRTSVPREVARARCKMQSVTVVFSGQPNLARI